MKNQPATPRSSELTPLFSELRNLIHSARRAIATTVNTLQVLTNFEIGRRIVEHEQKGAERAEYGKELLKELSTRLSEEFGGGFFPVNLSLMRKFFLTWKDRVSDQIFQTVSEKLHPGTNSRKASAQCTIAQTASGQSGNPPFTLSWSHYVLLLTIKNPEERSFYGVWSGRNTKFRGSTRIGITPCLSSP